MYALSALIGSRDLLRAGSKHLRTASLVELTAVLAMIPVTKELRAELGAPGVDASLSRFECLSRGVQQLAIALSQAGPVAYVEAEYFGGTGGQASVVFEQGRMAAAPLATQTRAPTTPSDPINTILRILGVERAPGLDEFDTVGLGRHRHTDDWH